MDNLPFKKQAKIRLIELGLTQTQLSKRLKIPRNRINDAIADRSEGNKYRKAIARFLKISL